MLCGSISFSFLAYLISIFSKFIFFFTCYLLTFTAVAWLNPPVEIDRLSGSFRMVFLNGGIPTAVAIAIGMVAIGVSITVRGQGMGDVLRYSSGCGKVS